MGFDENFATIWKEHSGTFWNIREFSALRDCMNARVNLREVSALKVPQRRPSWECKQEADDLKKFYETFEFKSKTLPAPRLILTEI